MGVGEFYGEHVQLVAEQVDMSPVAPAPEKEPPVQYPSCPGCPTPEEATRKEGGCAGPQRVGLMSTEVITVAMDQIIQCEEIIMCPKTQKTITR